MKKFIKSFILFLLAGLSSFVYADDFNLENVNSEFTGIYVPVSFDQVLNRTLSFDQAYASYGNAYSVLILSEKSCSTTKGFHESFSVTSQNFNKWNFISRGNEIYILDENGCSYKRISENFEKGFNVFYEYVFKVIFQDALHFNNIYIKDGRIFIDDDKFYLNCESSFFESSGVTCWLYGNKENYALVRNGIGATIYKAGRGSYAMLLAKTDEVYKEIPYFYWNDKKYPDLQIWNLEKNEYRFLRNLIFAKHGYSFKSDELKEIFNNMDFYKADPSFSENDFSDGEKQLLDMIQKKEEK